MYLDVAIFLILNFIFECFSSQSIYLSIYLSSSSCHTASTISPLSLSFAIRPYNPSLPIGLLDSILYSYRTNIDKFLWVSQHLHVHVKRVHWRTSIICSSLHLQQCPACFVRLNWMVLDIGCRWPYSYCFV